MTLNPFAFSTVSLLAAVASHMVLGMLWYSPMLFGTAWLRGLKFNEKDMNMHAGHLIGTALIGLTLALVLGHLGMLLGVNTCSGSIELALTCWLGFIALTHFSQVIWAQKPVAIWMIDIGSYAVNMTVIACIMTQLG